MIKNVRVINPNHHKNATLILFVSAIVIKLIIGVFFIDQTQVKGIFDFVSEFTFQSSPWSVYFAKKR